VDRLVAASRCQLLGQSVEIAGPSDRYCSRHSMRSAVCLDVLGRALGK
jgi:hypothetical protein